MLRPAGLSGDRGSAAVDFVFTSFALLAIFVTAMGIVINLYLRTTLTNAATDAARLLARADISAGCSSNEGTGAPSETSAQTIAIEQARRSTQALIGDKLETLVTANASQIDGYCTAVVTISANLPGLPLMNHITNFEATAHATLEHQQ